MLATLTERRFSDKGWLYERKLDGVRALAVRHGGAPRLWSRNEKRVDASYPEIVDALADLGGEGFVADGEIVAFDGAQTSFARLQGRIHLTGARRIEATGVAAEVSRRVRSGPRSTNSPDRTPGRTGGS
jgi:ATP-dependent DNA ligase